MLAACSFAALLAPPPLGALASVEERRRARASEQITALCGSPARWPQASSRLKPLRTGVSFVISVLCALLPRARLGIQT